MLTNSDERKGLVKVYWEDIRSRVKKVSPIFAKLIDELSPNKTFPLYLAYYPYGDYKGDTITPFLPKINGGLYRLSSQDAPKEVITHLGYGSHSSPFGMLLENSLEYFIDLKNLKITIPWKIISPGAFFPLGRLFPNKSKRIYSPNGVLSVVAGARSVFMLPKIGCQTNHLILRKKCNIQSSPPKFLYDHWDIFKDIVKNNSENNNWRACVLYFSQKWMEKIQHDEAWLAVKKLLLELAWGSYEYERNVIYYNIAYSFIQNKRNLKPNPYLVDTACHLFTIGLGAVPGYAPLCNNELLPLDVIQREYVESYGMKKYIPTVIGPSYFQLENKNGMPVYYSLQCPTTLSFSPKSRKLSSTMFEMHELKHIMDVFLNELSLKDNLLSDTVISDVAKNVKFDFYHNMADKNQYIQKSSQIFKLDNRFGIKNTLYSTEEAAFAIDAPFVRGCIRVGLNKN